MQSPNISFDMLVPHRLVLIFLEIALLSVLAGARNAKRGIANVATHTGDISKAGEQSSTISWEYGWNVPPPNPMASGVSHVPMQWGESGIANFISEVKAQKVQVILVCVLSYVAALWSVFF